MLSLSRQTVASETEKRIPPQVPAMSAAQTADMAAHATASIPLVMFPSLPQTHAAAQGLNHNQSGLEKYSSIFGDIGLQPFSVMT